MIPSELLAIIYDLASAATWGSGDFSGGFGTKTSSVAGLLLIGSITGVILLSIVALWIEMARTLIAAGYQTTDPFSVAGVHQYGQRGGMVDIDFG